MSKSLIPKLEAIKQRYNEVADLIIQPDVISDQKRYGQLNKEYSDLGKIVRVYDDYKGALDSIKESDEIIADGSDKDLVDLAKLEKLEAQQALFAAQKEHGISMFGGVGCFPILIQMPFFSAIYFAAQHTEGVAQASYLGIPLGSPSMILVAFAGILYYLQSLLSLHGVEDETQREQIKKMLYMSPLMIVVFSVFSPASVTLYWVVGGFMMILQQFIINYIVRPKLRKKVREEFAKNPPKASKTSSTRKDVTPEPATAITTSNKKKNKKRNAGKQHSR